MRIYRVFFIIAAAIMPNEIFCQIDSVAASGKLKKLSLEELMNMEVTSVSKRAEKLSETASAIQVITNEDIRRSGATNVPEALRLCPNLQVAQIKSNAWIISARGFNASFPNKLLVLIDGRTVYTPLFAGIFWDVQSVLLEDVDRIEVISGPGGTLWGANAVNGVINIITKNAAQSKGLYVSAAAGSFLQKSAAVRYGGDFKPGVSYQVFAQHNSYDNTKSKDGKDNPDSSQLTQAGFRIDWNRSQANNFTLLGNYYYAEEKTIPEKSPTNGQNILGRWTHNFSGKSELTLQAYFDRTWRKDIPSTITDKLNTFDIDLQHRFMAGKRHVIIWGGGYRLMQNEMQNGTVIIGFLPPKKTMSLFGGFVQDDIMLVPEKFKLTIGTKLQHNTFSGWEVQPNVRATWMPADDHTVWAAVSRAVRTPSRIDMDYFIPTYPLPDSIAHVAGGPDFVSEKVVAYELGYHVKPFAKAALSLSLFYNRYDDLYSVEALPGTLVYQTQNGGKGYSYGMEFSGNYQVFPAWRLRGGYTYFYKKLENKPGHTADYSALGIDPKNQFLLQSLLDLPAHFQLDIVGRYVDSLPVTLYTPVIPSHFTADARIAWQYKTLEISFTGRNLLKGKHPEFGTAYLSPNFYARITCRF